MDGTHIDFYRTNLKYLMDHVRVRIMLPLLLEEKLVTHRDYEELTKLCKHQGDTAVTEKLVTEVCAC